MTTDLPIRCDCGKLEGVARAVSPTAGTHLTCYCDDCQRFQHLIGHADRVLDEHGGTVIFQMSAGRIEITRGREHLACLRLTPKGTLRWYASCCNAPLGNTLATPALPFCGVITTCFDRSAAGGEAVDRALGPLKPGVFGKFALGDRTAIDAHDRIPLSAIRILGKVIGWRLGGAAKHSPFFDSEGKPVAAPRIVSEEGSPPAR